jgi:hypothetical protein
VLATVRFVRSVPSRPQQERAWLSHANSQRLRGASNDINMAFWPRSLVVADHASIDRNNWPASGTKPHMRHVLLSMILLKSNRVEINDTGAAPTSSTSSMNRIASGESCSYRRAPAFSGFK